MKQYCVHNFLQRDFVCGKPLNVLLLMLPPPQMYTLSTSLLLSCNLHLQCELQVKSQYSDTMECEIVLSAQSTPLMRLFNCEDIREHDQKQTQWVNTQCRICEYR